MPFTVKRFTSNTECERQLGRALRAYRQLSSKTAIVLLLSDTEPFRLARKLPNLGLFPNVQLHITEPSSLLNQIDWQKVVARRVLQHYFNSFIFLTDYIEYSRYLRVPIGNLPADHAFFGLDLLYARHLQKSGHALWATRASRPILGGKELDDVRLSIDRNPLSVDDTVLLNRETFCETACEAESPDIIDSSESPSESTQFETTALWKIAEEMPTDSNIRDQFLQMIGAYILEFLETNREMQFDTESAANFRADCVSQKISHRLYQIVNKLVHNNAESAHCAVFLVNAICRALSCDQTSQLAVEGVRDNAKRLLHNSVVEADMTPLRSTTLFVSNVFCNSCSQASNVFLSSTDEILTCTTCQSKLNSNVIDMMICERLNQLLTSYQIQDHQCTKCKSVRHDSLSMYCECCSPFVPQITPDQLKHEAATVETVATVRNFALSSELATWILKIL